MTDRRNLPDPSTMTEPEKLIEIIDNVRDILLTQGARRRWFDLQIPALGNKTPKMILSTGEDLTPLLLRTRSYLDDSFS